MPLHPALEAMLAQMAEAGGPALSDMTPAEGRAMYQAMQAVENPVAVTSVENAAAGDVPIRIYRQNDEVNACVVYFHGGGWVIGDLDTHDNVCRQLCDVTSYTVISVDYRLAPEHPYPAPFDDCYNTVCWVVDNAERLRIDPARIAVAGDSAGGNLSAAVCLKARDENGPAIAFQLLVYPVTDTAGDTESYEANGEGYMLTKDSMSWFWNHYIGHDDGLKDNQLVAPIKASDLSGLPPALVITAEFDPLKDEGANYADKLKAAGVATEYKDYAGMVHGFYGMSELLQESRDAFALSAEQLKKHLG